MEEFFFPVGELFGLITATEEDAMSTDNTPAQSAPETGLKKKNLVIIALVFAGLWFLAISSESYIVMGIVGVLTLIALVIAFWVWKQIRRHKSLAGMMQGAGDSPEARRKALARLEADKKADDVTNVIARAQLMAPDDASAALALLEPLEIKTVPAQMQDDFALLKSQLLLGVGRAKDARPLVDWINLDNPQRKEIRPLMVGIVAETWARTGSAKEANELLDSVELSVHGGTDTATVLLNARVFARFASGKKGKTREALTELATVDPNLLGRFISPKSRVHPGLQRLAREAFERSGGARQQARAHIAGGRGRRR